MIPDLIYIYFLLERKDSEVTLLKDHTSQTPSFNIIFPEALRLVDTCIVFIQELQCYEASITC